MTYKKFAVVYGVVLTAFTAYVLLDTFVIPTKYTSAATSQPITGYSQSIDVTDETDITLHSLQEDSSTAEIDADSTTDTQIIEDYSQKSMRDTLESNQQATEITENSYQDDNITIELKEYYENNTKIYVADIQLNSTDYLKTALASNTYGKNITQKTSEMAMSNNAILAINGDYYGAKESGYVIRNGTLYRDYGSSDTDVLCIYADGHFEITNSSEKTAQQLISEGVVQAFSFGPALVEKGQISVSKGEEVGKAMASNPRTAIGIIDDKHYVFVVSDGRTSESEGLSLSELAEFMQSIGVTCAYNLDGGGSSTMYFNGEIVNNPTTSGKTIKERSVSDIVYIGY